MGVVIEASCIKPSWLNVLLSTKYHAATTINVFPAPQENMLSTSSKHGAARFVLNISIYIVVLHSVAVEFAS